MQTDHVVNTGTEAGELTEGERRVKKPIAISSQNLVREGKVSGDLSGVDMNTTHRGGDDD